jgi:hypothetical protein
MRPHHISLYALGEGKIQSNQKEISHMKTMHEAQHESNVRTNLVD